MLYKVKAQITNFSTLENYEKLVVIKEEDIDYIQQKNRNGNDFYIINLKESIELFTEWNVDAERNNSRTLLEIEIKSLDDMEVLR